MRSTTILMPLILTAFVACSAFGAKDSPTTPDDPTPPAQDPSTNATPPVTGTPIVGIFVSTSKGDDAGGTGSELHPWKTLAAAMRDAKQKGQRVIACGETYAETVTLLDGVSLFGGYDCGADEWKTGTTRSQIRSATSPAVLATGLALETRVDGFEIYAPDFAGDMPSQTARTSVALEVDQSMNLTFANSLVQSGSGGPGADGTDGKVNSETSAKPNGVDAAPASGQTGCPFFPNCATQTEWQGSAGGTSKCALGASGGNGGKGGNGTFWNKGGSCNIIPVADAMGAPATASTAAGGNSSCTDASNATLLPFQYGRGTTLPGAADGSDGMNGAWSIAASGFAPGNGTAGNDGTAGIGGGGGGGTYSDGPVCNACRTGNQPTYLWSAAGGGGGAGGCAGFAGTPGFGGGASIAAFVTNSVLTFSNVSLQGGAGGVGGKGTLGSDGLPGGAGGAFAAATGTSAGGGSGGDGAHGGYGGLSGHGTPGPSIALVYTGARPTTSDNTALVPGSGGPTLPALTKPANQGTKMLPAVSGQSLTEQMF